MRKKKFVICKTCGYIMELGKVHDVCPACGAPKEAFDPYVPNTTAKRARILALHLHPIILHFPQAIVVLALFTLFLMLFTVDTMHDNLLIVTQFNLLLLPFSVAGGAISGVLDGKVRFKSITPPILMNKIGLSIIFQVLSIVTALLVFLVSFGTGLHLLLLLLVLIQTICAVILGRVGSSLTECIYPG